MTDGPPTDDVSEWADEEELIDDLVDALERDRSGAYTASTGVWLVQERANGDYVVYKAQGVRGSE